MKNIKRLFVMLITLSVVVFCLGACGKEVNTNTETNTEKETQIKTDETVNNETTNDETTNDETTNDETTNDETTNDETTNDETTNDETTNDETLNDENTETITVEEAIELVKRELGEEFTYVPADDLEEKDGSQYYVIYVDILVDTGNLTTVTTYLVKTDGSEVFDKYVTSLYIGEFVHSGETGETVFKVLEDNTFEMVTTGVVNQVVSGVYEFGITDDANVIKLILHPRKNVIESDGETREEEVTDAEGTAIIENGTLTLTMESMETVFTKIN